MDTRRTLCGLNPLDTDGCSRRLAVVADRRLVRVDWVGKRALPLGAQSAQSRPPENPPTTIRPRGEGTATKRSTRRGHFIYTGRSREVWTLKRFDQAGR